MGHGSNDMLGFKALKTKMFQKYLVIKFWVKLKCNSKHSLEPNLASTKGASALATNGNQYFEALCIWVR